MRYQRGTHLSALIAVSTIAGCATAPPQVNKQSRDRMLALLLPSRIEIVEPFTRVSSFDDDSTPDGIELLLRAVNSLDNPGLMIVGHIRIELYEFIQASGVPRGKRYAAWEVELGTEEQQRTYWNQLTQMYEFRLAVDPAQVPPADKYLLLVTYDSPLAEHLTDEFVIQYRGGKGPLHSSVRVRGAR